MRSKLGILLLPEILKLTGINQLRYEKDKKKRNRALAMAVIIPIVSIVMAGYCFAFSFGLGFLGLIEIIPGYALTITSLIILFFTFSKTNGFLFAAKDYDMLMAMPIKTETIITVKFLSMYISNLFFAVLVMLPMGIGYAIWKGWSFAAMLIWFIVTLIAPLFPMTIAALIGLVIMVIGSGSKHRVFVQVFLSAVLVIILFVGGFWLQEKSIVDEEAFLLLLSDFGTTLSASAHRIYPLSAWFDGALKLNCWEYLTLLVLASIAVYGLFILSCTKMYRKINTALKAHHQASHYKLGELKTSTILTALVKKEAKRFTSSTVYMINTGMGLLITLIMAIGSLFVNPEQIIEAGIPEGVNVMGQIAGVAPFMIAMLVNMCCTTSVSLSLEGKNLWIVQSLPIDKKTLLRGKMLFNVLLVLPVSLLCSIIFIFKLRTSLLMSLDYILFAVASVLFSTAYGMWINVHFPNYEWENEIQVIKQGMGSMFGILGNMLIYIIAGGIGYVLCTFWKEDVLLLLFSALFAGMSCLLYRACK